MKIFSLSLLISLLTVFAATANAGSDGSEDQANQQPKPRLANCTDCMNAGYRRGYAAGEAATLENTPRGSSSVTTPLSYRKPVYVQAPSTKSNPLLQRIKAPRQQPIKQSVHHAGHGHHTQAQVLDCELTDSLNRGVSFVTTIISTETVYRASTANKHHYKPTRKPAPMKQTLNVKHDNHYHHTEVERADCALTDALNRGPSLVTRVISTSSYPQHSPSKPQHTSQHFAHAGHGHHSEVDRADCALTDALNRQASVVHVVKR